MKKRMVRHPFFSVDIAFKFDMNKSISVRNECKGVNKSVVDSLAHHAADTW